MCASPSWKKRRFRRSRPGSRRGSTVTPRTRRGWISWPRRGPGPGGHRWLQPPGHRQHGEIHRSRGRADQVALIIGGFHLTARGRGDLIQQTIQGLKEINPELIIAGHCTGFRALTKLAAAFPDNFMVSCVGTKVLVVEMGTAMQGAPCAPFAHPSFVKTLKVRRAHPTITEDVGERPAGGRPGHQSPIRMS